MLIILLFIQNILGSFRYLNPGDNIDNKEMYMIITTNDNKVDEAFFEKFGGMFIHDVFVKKDINSELNSFKVYEQNHQELPQYRFEFDQPIKQTREAIMLYYYQLDLLDTEIFSYDHYQFLKKNLKIFFLYVGKKNKNSEKVNKYKIKEVMFFSCFDWKINQRIIKSFNETQVAQAELDYLFVLRDESLQTEFDMDYQLVYDFDNDFRIEKFILIEQFQKIDTTLEIEQILNLVKEKSVFYLLCITDNENSKLAQQYIQAMDEVPKIYISQIVLNTSDKYKKLKELFQGDITDNGMAFIYYKDDKFQTDYRKNIQRKDEIVQFEDDFFHRHQNSLDGAPSGEGEDSEEEMPMTGNQTELQLNYKKFKRIKKIKTKLNLFLFKKFQIESKILKNETKKNLKKRNSFLTEEKIKSMLKSK